MIWPQQISLFALHDMLNKFSDFVTCYSHQVLITINIIVNTKTTLIEMPVPLFLIADLQYVFSRYDKLSDIDFGSKMHNFLFVCLFNINFYIYKFIFNINFYSITLKLQWCNMHITELHSCAVSEDIRICRWNKTVKS